MGDMQLVRFKHGKDSFEVLSKPGSVLKYRKGALGWDNVLVSEIVFKNSAKGDRASASELVYVRCDVLFLFSGPHSAQTTR
jgi:ribosome maturation protein Sdo1